MVRFVLAGAGAVLALLLAVPLVVLAAPFWVVSALSAAIARLLAAVRAPARDWREMVRFDAEIGWTPRPDLDLRIRAETTIHVTTDREGWRGRARLDDADVVVFGDSFCYGHGTDDVAFFADRVPGRVVKAVGADGYNLVQEFQWMRRLGARLSGKLVLWTVFYGNDLLDNLTPDLFGHRQPFVRKRAGASEWEVVTDHVREDPWPRVSVEYHSRVLAELCCDTYRSRRAFDAAEAILGWGQDHLAECGAGLAVVGLPDPAQVDPVRLADLAGKAPDPESFDPSRPDRELSNICDRLGVRFASLTPRLHPRDFLLRDVHWTPSGNAKMAALVAELAAEVEVPRGPSARPRAGNASREGAA